MNDTQYPAGWLAINSAQMAANDPKHDLIVVLRKLEADPSRAARKSAERLSRLIGYLEAWQNAPKPKHY